MTSNENQKGFWHGALLLTAVALFMKVLSVGYRIPYQNITGDIGFYVYQQIYPFYSIAIILATYGFPVVISRLVAEQMARNNSEKAEEISRYSYYVLTLLGLIGFAALYMGAPALADLMDDAGLIMPLRATAFAFLIMPGIASTRGYFQGHENVIPTAWSQVTEQTVRVIAILAISISLVMNGYGAYATGTGAALGSILGGVAALVLLVVVRIKVRKVQVIPRSINALRFWDIARRLLTEGTLICVSALVMVLFQLMDALTIVSGLSEYGLSSIEARETKGIFDRGQPLIQVGTVLATSLSLSIVPVISKARAEKNNLLIQEKAGLSLKISFVIGLSAAAGLACIMNETNTMLFTDDSLSRTLSFLAVSILFSSLAMTAASILQGIGLARTAARYAGLGILLKGFLNIVLVPIIGIDGAAVGTVIGLASVALLTIYAVHSKVGLIQYPFHIGRTITAVVIMCSAVIMLQTLFPSVGSRTLASVSALGGAVVGVSVLGLTLMMIGVFTDNELVQLPKGNKLRLLQNNLRKGV
ncbi:putative polysaccharide biosynthesis protein [Guptibacillus hwajinpoensis]|uniref:PST family polysaccharide transporter n=1 Tax=Guptibacillus hwajinpoensis TaxID=208199 RepID=A0ABU0K6T2_9BACL|nr:polysaccharide biosynthesis protein [Alkalihalobacillus hemicentroti]MDQ0485087.1 PST family polysaccharide transporter [Alkalihalobacillus hemicentroti]